MRHIALLLCVIAFASAAPSPPQLPATFTAEVNFTTTGAPPQSGKLYYSYPVKSLRMDTTMFGQPDIELELYGEGTRYSYAEGQCKSSPLKGQMPIYFMPPGVSFIGVETINNIQCNGWSLSQSGLAATYWTAVVPPQSIVRSNITVTSPFGNMVTIIDFADVDTSSIPASTFDPPSYC